MLGLPALFFRPIPNGRTIPNGRPLPRLSHQSERSPTFRLFCSPHSERSPPAPDFRTSPNGRPDISTPQATHYKEGLRGGVGGKKLKIMIAQ